MVDPITVSVVQHRLGAIVEEMLRPEVVPLLETVGPPVKRIE